MPRRIALVCSLFLLSACSGGSGSSPSSPSIAAPANLESIFTLTIPDASGDFELAPAEGPPTLVQYAAADVNNVRLGVSGQYLYIQVTYAAPVPTAAVTIPAQSGMPTQFVRRQSISFNFNVDGNSTNGASAFPVITGIDIFFGFAISYGSVPDVYAHWDFANGDIHQNRSQMQGEVVQSSSANTVTARFDVSSLGSFFPRGANVIVGGWSEAESSDAAGNTLYHHFAYDPYTAANWTIPR